MTPKNLLVIQLARLGDLVQTWPLLKSLRQLHPTAAIHLLGEKSLTALAHLIPQLNCFHSLDLQTLTAPLTAHRIPSIYHTIHALVDKLRLQGFHAVYNLNYSRASLLLTHLINAPARGYQPVAGGREFYREPWLAYIYGLVHARTFNRWHLSDVFRHLAPPPPSEPETGSLQSTPDYDLRLTALPSLSHAEPVIALQLATRHPKRTWPLEHFARLAFLLLQRLGGFLWLLGSPPERPLGERLRAALPTALRPRVVNLQGHTSLPELAARLQEAHLLVSGDTGTLHLAAALGTPTIGLFFGPASCFETGPYGTGHYVLQAEPPCHPCTEAHPDCEEPFCLHMLTPEIVAKLIWALVGHASSDQLPLLPANTRLYRSFLSASGTIYAPMFSTSLSFTEVVGQAYRRAGEALLGWSLNSDPPLALSPCQATREALSCLLRSLKNGADPDRAPPSVAAALRPLAAFRADLRRQAIWAKETSAPDYFADKVRTALTAALETQLDLSKG